MNALIRLNQKLDRLLEFTSISATKAVLREIRAKGIPLHRPPMFSGKVGTFGPEEMIGPQFVPKNPIPQSPGRMLQIGPKEIAGGEPGIYIPRATFSGKETKAKRQFVDAYKEHGGYQPTTILQHEYGHSQTMPDYAARFERLGARLNTNPGGVRLNPAKTNDDLTGQIGRIRASYGRGVIRREKAADDYAQGFLSEHGTPQDMAQYRGMAAKNRLEYRERLK